ncbi:TonB-dependent receptor domain-containing protein [Acinetobacter puyangensis]|uniref:TonB-dependent receptor domain-containing protein n=1 Tax=Acinetobacter puyangensis TaxID=1096779 RepID=UPI003A4DDAD2
MLHFKVHPLSIALLSLVSTTTIFAETEQSEKVVKLEPIVVTTAGGYAQNIADAAATISVITAEELEKKSYSDVTDALKNVPGVYIQGGGTNQTVMIRGMGSSYTLYLIDGKPMNDGSLLTTNGGVQGASINFLPPIEAIERIEVIRGPSSSLYGSDAMGGVINIITKKHQDKATASIKTEYIKADKSNKVNNDATNTSIYINAPLIDKLLSLQITGGYQTIEESNFQANSTESNESDPEFTKKNIGGKFIFTPDKNNTIIAEYSNTVQERTHTPGISMLETANRSYSELEKNNYNLSHEAKYDHFVVNSYVQYDKDKNNSITGRTVGSVTNPGGIEFETLTANSQGTYFFNDNSLTVGANYKKETLEDGTTNQNASMAGKVTKMDRYQWALFAEDTWHATNDLALTLSGRYDNNEQFGSNFSPKAYAVYNATDTLILKGGVISGYKAPSLRNSSPNYMLNSMGGAIMANPDLKPEKSLTYEMGMAYENSDLGLTGSLMVFKTDFKDKITRSSRMEGSQDEGSQFYIDNPNLPYNAYGYTYNYNVDEAEIKGVEITTDYYILDQLKYRQSYTYTDSEEKSGANKGKPLNNISKHMFNAGLDWDLTDQVLLWTQLNYRGKTIGDSNGVETPSYTFVDLGAVYKYNDKMQFTTGVYNIANKNVKDDGNAYVLDGRRYSFAMNLRF